jgi:hypothetical protein
VREGSSTRRRSDRSGPGGAEIEELRAKLEVLEDLVAELANEGNGGAR